MKVITRKMVMLRAVLCAFAFMTTSCNSGDDTTTTGDSTTTTENGTTSTGTDTTATTTEQKTQIWHDIVTITNEVGKTSDCEPNKRVKVNLTVTNIPTTLAAEGTKLTIAGYYLCDCNGKEYSWNNNSDTKNPTSTEFVKEVADSSVSFVFYWNTEYKTTDFKIFEDGTWNEVITDPMNEGDTNGNGKGNFARQNSIFSSVSLYSSSITFSNDFRSS